MPTRTNPSVLQLLALGACLAGAASAANAGVYTGTWDPAFTTSVSGDFAGLGWKVSAKVVIPDGCGTTGVLLNGTVGACGAASPMTMEQVNLYFYSLASPATVLGTINFGTFGLANPLGPGPSSGETQELRTAAFGVGGTPTLGTSFAMRQTATTGYSPLSDYQFSFSLTNQVTGLPDPHLVYTTSTAMSLYDAEVLYNQRSAQGYEYGGSVDVPLLYTAEPLGPADLYVDPYAPVPEPGTWAMLAAGLAAVGVAARRRRA